MTTITTEIALRIAAMPDDERLRRGDLEALLQDRAAAQWLAQQLVQVARQRWPGRRWTITDLLDVLQTAVHGVRTEQPRIVEARGMRRHLRDRCRLADRYGEGLGVVVLHFLPDRAAERYATAVDVLLRRMRPDDSVVLFRRHAVFVHGRLREESLGCIAERVVETAREALGEAAAVSADTFHYQGGQTDAQRLLDWVEDQIR